MREFLLTDNILTCAGKKYNKGIFHKKGKPLKYWIPGLYGVIPESFFMHLADFLIFAFFKLTLCAPCCKVVLTISLGSLKNCPFIMSFLRAALRVNK